MQEFTSFVHRLRLLFLSIVLVSLSFIYTGEAFSNPSDYTYKTIIINGVNWIFVYDGDILIDSYPDDEF